MKHLGKLAILGAVLAVSAQFASASSIDVNLSVAGSDTFDTSQITFLTAFVTTGELNGVGYAPGTSVNLLTAGVPLTYTPGGTVSPALNFATIGGLDFYVTSETFTYSVSGAYDVLNLMGTGYFTLAGYDNTNATFDLTSQEKIGTTSGSFVKGSFSASAAAAEAPEPNSLILLGTGLLSGAGMLMRKRRTV